MASEKTSKVGNVGGPLLRAAGNIVGRAARRPVETGEQAAQGMTDRLRGRAAYRASRSGPVGRIVFAIMGNQVVPTRRQTAARIERGNTRHTEENQHAQRILRNRQERSGGVAEGKQAWVDACRGGLRGRRFAEQAIILLLNTQSWVEFQDSFIQGGPNQDKRVTEIAAWQDVLTEDPQLWALVAERRPDLTPDVMQGAEQALGYTYESLSGQNRPALDGLSQECMVTAIGRLNVANISRLHESFFSEIGILNDATLSLQLYDQLHDIAQLPGHHGWNALGSFAGGPRQDALDDALAPSGLSYADL